MSHIEIENVHRTTHLLRINGLVRAYIGCDNGMWYAQVTETITVPPYYQVTGPKQSMSRVDAMDEIKVCERLGIDYDD